MFTDDFGNFGEYEGSRAITQKKVTRENVVVWSNHFSRKLWLLQGKPLPIMTKAELQFETRDRVTVTDEVDVEFHALGGFDIQENICKNHQGTPAE